jgi:hypothetical protein
MFVNSSCLLSAPPPTVKPPRMSHLLGRKTQGESASLGNFPPSQVGVGCSEGLHVSYRFGPVDATVFSERLYDNPSQRFTPGLSMGSRHLSFHNDYHFRRFVKEFKKKDRQHR